MDLFLGHDLGTGGVKSVLVDGSGRLVAEAMATYSLSHPRAGWAEQDPGDWWRAVVETTRQLVADVDTTTVRAMCFAGQMLALAPLDAAGEPTRPAISWLDGRAGDEARAMTRRMGGQKILRLLAGASPTGKDIVAKIAWIRRHEPDVFRQTHAFCDATGYLVARATGRIAMDPTAAGGTGVLSLGSGRWSRLLARASGLPLDKMPPLLGSAEVAGELSLERAGECGLRAGVPVAMGMADIPAAAVGSGAVRSGDAHVYLGTSAWIGVTLDTPRSVPRAGIAVVPAAAPGAFLLIGESETAGACREWVERAVGVTSAEALDALVERAEPGARGLLFAPWLFGERSPVPDATLRGGFLGLSLEHGPEHLARAVHEGVALNLGWILDEISTLSIGCAALRAVGGGSQSDAWLQILADATGRRIERVVEPRHAGAIGAALVGAVAVGALPSVEAIGDVVSVDRVFEPRPALTRQYRAHAAALREAHPLLSRLARTLGEQP